jgi:hypothetical protein
VISCGETSGFVADAVIAGVLGRRVRREGRDVGSGGPDRSLRHGRRCSHVRDSPAWSRVTQSRWHLRPIEHRDRRSGSTQWTSVPRSAARGHIANVLPTGDRRYPDRWVRGRALSDTRRVRILGPNFLWITTRAVADPEGPDRERHNPDVLRHRRHTARLCRRAELRWS